MEGGDCELEGSTVVGVVVVVDGLKLARLAEMLFSVAWLQSHYIIDAAATPL